MWTLLIQELVKEHGLTQPLIAAAVGCGQSTISDLASGKTIDPRHSTGEALKELLATKRAELARAEQDRKAHGASQGAAREPAPAAAATREHGNAAGGAG